MTLFQAVNAQTVSTYSIKAPVCVLEKDAKVYIEGFNYTGTETGDANFSKKMSNNITSNLTQGFNSKILSMIPWANNKLYTVVQSAGEATHIVYGDFTHTASAPVSNKKTDKAVITDGAFTGLYVHYLTFSESADVNFSGNLKVKKADNTDIYSQKFGKQTKANQTSQFVPAKKALDVNRSIASLGTQIANSGLYGIMGVQVFNQNYKLKKIKIETKDKAAKKQIKALQKNIKKTLKSNQYSAKETGKYLLEILSLEKSANTQYNIGICYIAIGNYTKAKEYLDASGIGNNIDDLINERKKLENLGVEIIENDF